MLAIALAFVLLAQDTLPISATPSTSAEVLLSAEVTHGAEAWLLATYPSLRRGDVTVHVFGDKGAVRLHVIRETAAQAPGSRSISPPVLVVDVVTTPDGRVETVAARGPLVQSAALDDLKALVTAHPEWTESDISSAIAAAGGTYGPDADLSSVAAQSVLSDVLRSDGTVAEKRFAVTPIGPVWLVDVATARRTYQLAFEPMRGQLIGIAPK
jgi:hypothetical protein